ncbi:MAG: RCC1 domain-containing protein, partial [Gemmatimonadales bacterium]
VDAEGNHTCGVTGTGETYCWGDNAYGQLGNGTLSETDAPTAVVNGSTFQSIELGISHTCAVEADGTAYCWGANSQGQLGLGFTGSRNMLTPSLVVGGMTFQAPPAVQAASQ